MDAVEFLKQSKRMCRSMECCSDCPLYVVTGLIRFGHCGGNDMPPEERVRIVEQWSKYHREEK